MKLNWAFNSATVMKLNWDEEFRFWERFGWKAVEPWYDKVTDAVKAGRTVASLAKQMKDAGIKPIGVAPAITMTRSSKPDVKAEEAAWAQRLDVTAELGAPALTFIALGELSKDHASEYAYLSERFRLAGDMAAQRGVRVNLEFLGTLPVNGTLGAGIDMVREVNHPAVGMLFDLVHYYVSASHAEELVNLPAGKMFHVHVDDSPRLPMEQLTNDFRVFPGEGRIDTPGLINLVRKLTKFDGWYGIEIYDNRIWALDPVEVFERTAKSVEFVESRIE
jgi:2-keto-myo-inositol isomerase